ncbi:MAG: restriction endonuclease subunit S [Planctomycetes bacterium]|nr:restriction endonuclease subunit S [Planctomycetota bacterium]MCC7066644.1 restriction endonuclease subunit S [Planctomycetota bacterium]
MSFPRYPKYKDSGAEWLGDVPAHWAVARIRHGVDTIEQGWSPQCEGEPVSSQDQWGVLKVGCVNGGTFDPSENKALPSDLQALPELGIRRGDVLISRANTRELVGSAAVPDIDHPNLLLCDKLYRLRLNVRATGAFVQRFLQSTGARGQIELAASGASASMVNISQEVILGMACVWPPLEEQEAIATFLDRETAKIDALVAEQQRLVELLKEKRQAVISHAVTKGLNPDAPMKPSGVEWLGDVPAHWTIVDLKQVITGIGQGWSPQCESEPAAEGEWGVLKVGCVNGDQFDEHEQKALPADVAPMREHEIRPGDILMSRGNTLDLVGMAAIVGNVRPRLLLSDLLYRFRSDPSRASAEFVAHSLRSVNVRAQLQANAVGTSASMKKVAQSVIREIVMPLPALSEQVQVVQLLGRQLSDLDALTAEAERAITLLQERRTALISAAVTGQIDVRGAATEVA